MSSTSLPRVPTPAFSVLFLFSMGLLSTIWLIHRADSQSITLDEANTYLHWVRPPLSASFTPHSNNHILNSLLMRLCTGLFGLSHLSLRLPSLLGGLLYLLSMGFLCNRIAKTLWLRCILYVSLTANPFIMDYLVAARGYGLSLGFYAIGLLLLWWILTYAPQANSRVILLASTATSCAAALSFSSNFSSAYFVFFLWLASALLLLRSQSSPAPRQLRLILITLTFPGSLLVAVICGYALLNFPQSQLFWGTNSLTHLLVELNEASFAVPNRSALAVALAPALPWIKSYAAVAILLAALLGVGLLLRSRQKRAGAQFPFATALFAILAFALLTHWLQFVLANVPLPFERTSIWVVPLLTLATGSIFAALPATGTARFLRLIGTAGLTTIGIYFTAALRDDYFREWSICADIRAAFPIIRQSASARGTREVISDLNYSPSLNVYRHMENAAELGPIPNLEHIPSGKSVYALPKDRYKDFIHRENLRIVFAGKHSDFTVLVRDSQSPTPMPDSKAP